MSNPAVCEELTAKSYEELTANFDWSIAERELGYRPGEADQHWLDVQRPHLPPGNGRQGGPLLGRLPGQSTAVHLR